MMSLKERYEKLEVDRLQFLQRARHNAMLTIPSLMPLEGHDGKSHLIEPYQSLGAVGVVSLSSRVSMALIPAGRPHLRLDIPPKQLLEMDGEVPPDVERSLAKGERLIQHGVERANWRASTLESSQQLIVAGSVTEQYMPDNTIRVHRLDHFVWRRDERGRIIECVIKEFWDKDALPEGVSAPGDSAVGMPGRSGTSEYDVCIFTGVRLMSDGTYNVRRETEAGVRVGEAETYESDMVPFLFLTWSRTSGEDYGRSKVEEHVSDLRSLDSLSKQALEQGAMAAMNFVMVRPGATAQGVRNRITRISNGDVVLGDPESVELKQFTNSQGYQITADAIQRLEERLSRGFLLLAPGQRNAERVTATEIRRDIEELESVLGGTFSSISLEMMERRTILLLENMKAAGEFPNVNREDLQPTILTGLEALSRERDVERGIQAAQIVAQFGELGMMHIKFPVVLGKIMNGLGFPDAVKSAEEVAQEQQQQQAMQMAQAAAPGVAQEAVKQQAQGGGAPDGG
jgi:hypothetical protein